MSATCKGRTNLPFVDPAESTPQFRWRNVGRAHREVYCEGVPLAQVAARYGTPTYVYSQCSVENAFDEIASGLRRLPHLLCFAVKANGNLSLLKLLAARGSGFDIVSGG